MSLKDKVLEILDGIDRTELDGGWWETSTGAEFGSQKLAAVLAAIEQLPEGRPFPRLMDYAVGLSPAAREEYIKECQEAVRALRSQPQGDLGK